MSRWIGGLLAWWLMATLAMGMTLSEDDKRINLLPALSYLEDPDGRLQLPEVQTPAQQKRFQTWEASGSALNFGLTASHYWIRVRLQREPAAPDLWYLEVSNALLGELTLHTPNGTVIRTGIEQPLRNRPSFSRHFVFPVELSEQTQDFYLRVGSSNALSVPMELWQPYAYQQHLHWHMLMQFVYFGCMLTLLLFNIFLSGLLKDIRFLIYALYSLAMGMGMFAGNGFGGLFLWPDWHQFDAIGQSAFLCLAIIFATDFARRLLDIPHTMPRIDLWLRGSTVLSIGVLTALLLHLWHPMPLPWITWVFMLLSLQMGVVILYMSVRQALVHKGSARYFAIGWGLLWAGAVTASFHAMGAIPSNGFTSYALQISTVFEMLFLAFSLASKVREERGQRDLARQQALSAQTELVQVLRTSEQRLEQTVQQRTLQLEQSLERERTVLQQYLRFGSMISHEVRNPIHIIQSQISLWRKEKSLGMDHTPARINTISTALHRLTDLFEKWLQSDRLKSPHLQLDLQKMDLQTWLDGWLPAYQDQLPEHRLVWVRGEHDSQVEIDSSLLEIAVTNLIENAAKYSLPGTSITVSVLSPQSTHVGLCVSDEGSGIPAHFQGRVFEDFFRTQPESNKPGMGLGLSIVQRITELHGGRVELRPALSCQGACFCIWLPRLP